MSVLFVICIIIDVLFAALYLYREAFVISSNKNRVYKRRFALMLLSIAGGLALRPFNLLLACLVAGIPALMLGTFLIFMMVVTMTHKGPWQ